MSWPEMRQVVDDIMKEIYGLDWSFGVFEEWRFCFWVLDSG